MPDWRSAIDSEAVESTRWLTVPNVLTLLRIGLIVPFVSFAMSGRDRDALIIFLIAGLTDTLDGTIARRFGQTSKIGRLVDPMADKLLTGVAYFVLSLLRSTFAAIPVWLMIAVIGRDVLILFGSLLVYRARRTTAFKPSWLGKLNTFLEIGLVVLFLAASFVSFLPGTLPFLYLVVAISITASGADYVRMGVMMMRDHGGR